MKQLGIWGFCGLAAWLAVAPGTAWAQEKAPQSVTAKSADSQDFVDVGSSENVTRLSEEETEKLREEFRVMKQSVTAGREAHQVAQTNKSIKAAKLASQSKVTVPRKAKS